MTRLEVLAERLLFLVKPRVKPLPCVKQLASSWVWARPSLRNG